MRTSAREGRRRYFDIASIPYRTPAYSRGHAPSAHDENEVRSERTHDPDGADFVEELEEPPHRAPKR